MAGVNGGSGAPPAPAEAGRRVDLVLVAGLLLLMLVAGLARAPNLLARLPDVLHPDEGTVVNRGVAALQGEVVPPFFDWPPASSYLYAGAAAVVRVFRPDVIDDLRLRFSVGRVLFFIVALLVVGCTGLLAARLVDTAPRRRVAAWVAAAAIAASFTAARLARISHPEQLQLLFMLLAAMAALRYDRTRGRAALAGTGVLAGLAGATKYLGIGVGLVALLAVVTYGDAWPRRRDAPIARTAGDLVILAGSAFGGFVVGTLGTTMTAGTFLEGFLWQLGHQAGGHLGYEADALPGWAFHLLVSFPGNWGWPMTVAVMAAASVVAVAGTRSERLIAAFVVTLYLVIGLSQIRLPHYVLVTYPFLGALAGSRVARLPARVTQPVVVAVLAASLAFSLLNVLRLTRIAIAPSTRLAADALVESLDGHVWSEAYSLTVPAQHTVFAFGDNPDVLDCDCYAAVSSFQEDRFRRRPDLYGEQIAVYDRIREEGEVVDTAAPFTHLSYRWDLLPQWGIGRIPLRGPVPTVGPTITIVDLRKAR